jgi:hypothetical protein
MTVILSKDGKLYSWSTKSYSDEYHPYQDTVLYQRGVDQTANSGILNVYIRRA